MVEVAGYDGRTAAEVVRDERGEDPAALKRCPKDQLGSSEEEHDPGTEGETVPPRPTSAVLIGLRYEGSSEVYVGIGPGLCGGNAALNLQDEKEYVATPRLLHLLDGLLKPDR